MRKYSPKSPGRREDQHHIQIDSYELWKPPPARPPHDSGGGGWLPPLPRHSTWPFLVGAVVGFLLHAAIG